ncbi:hypothetical protein ACU8KH_06104 [Lachancea thermotolerans]
MRTKILTHRDKDTKFLSILFAFKDVGIIASHKFDLPPPPIWARRKKLLVLRRVSFALRRLKIEMLLLELDCIESE